MDAGIDGAGAPPEDNAHHLSGDADAVVAAEWGKQSTTRTAQRHGYRHRDLDTRVGTVDLAIPKLRSGTYFLDWLLERRK